MAFDPCGTRKLEGDELIKRLAAYLKVDPNELTNVLKAAITSYEISKMDGQ